MAEPTVIQTGSAEQVALRLFDLVSHIERSGNPSLKVDRRYVLDTFTECLQAAKGGRASSTQAPTGSVVKPQFPNPQR